MRTPHVPESIEQRQVEPGILEAKVPTSVPGGNLAFGGVSPELQRAEVGTADMMKKISDQSDDFQAQKIKNFISTQRGQYLAQALTAKGDNTNQFLPQVKNGKYDPFYTELQKQALAMAPNDRIKNKVSEYLGNEDADMQNILQHHSAVQNTIAATTAASDGIKSVKSQLEVGNAYALPSVRDNILKNQDEAVENYGALMGSTPADIKFQQTKFRQDAYRRIIDLYNSDNNVRGAKEYIDDLKSKGLIDDKWILNQAPKITAQANKQDTLNYYSNNSILNQDKEGYVNPESLIRNFRNTDTYKNMTPDQQAKSESTLLGKVGQDKKKTDDQKSSRWNKFLDTLEPALQSNTPLNKLLAIPTQMGGYGSEKLRMEDFINRRYQERTGLSIFSEKNPDLAATKANLYEAIQDGTLTDRETIGKLFDQGQLNTKQLASAYKMFDTVNKGGPGKGIQMTRNLIVKQAMDILPEDQVNDFRGELAEQTQGMDAKAMQDWAKERLDPQMKNPSHFWERIMGNSEAAKDMSEDDMVKSLSFEVGKEPVTAMLSALATPENPKPGLNEIEGFVHKLGVPADELTRGKPVNNAMQSIINWNRNAPPSKIIPFTPEAIKYLAGKNNGYFEP